MKSIVSRTKLAALAAGLAMGLAGTAQATDLTFFKTVFNTDFKSAGYGGMRDNGTGTVSLTGVTGTVKEAYLFWHGPSNAAATSAATANSSVNFNGTDIVGSFLGISSDNCWGYENSLAYRANVTSLVTGSGDYSLANFTKDSNRINVNGVSLIVFFDDGNSSNNRDVVMFNGNDSNISNPYDADGWNITLNNINYSSGSASAQFHVADGQAFADAAVIANGNTIGAAGGLFDGNTVPNGPGNFSGGLWDIRDFSVTSLLNPGLNNLNITSGVSSDCLACVMIAIDLPAGAADNQPDPVSLPGSLALAGLGLVGMGASRRRKTA